MQDRGCRYGGLYLFRWREILESHREARIVGVSLAMVYVACLVFAAISLA
ncbi:MULTISPECIES: hypothetical protein [Bradyrhizobium]|jgi:hypothetical protein|nr:hypothetical protein [Bradyrhizobium elkanii]